MNAGTEAVLGDLGDSSADSTEPDHAKLPALYFIARSPEFREPTVAHARFGRRQRANMIQNHGKHELGHGAGAVPRGVADGHTAAAGIPNIDSAVVGTVNAQVPKLRRCIEKGAVHCNARLDHETVSISKQACNRLATFGNRDNLFGHAGETGTDLFAEVAFDAGE
jgi:hypothetical protein